MSWFLLPSSFRDSISALIKNFWWGGFEDRPKIHWKKWSLISRPKDEGGFGTSTPLILLCLLNNVGGLFIRLMLYGPGCLRQFISPIATFGKLQKAIMFHRCGWACWKGLTFLFRGAGSRLIIVNWSIYGRIVGCLSMTILKYLPLRLRVVPWIGLTSLLTLIYTTGNMMCYFKFSHLNKPI